MSADSGPLHLFAGYGVELEYMIVDAQRLDVMPLADRVLFEVAGTHEAEVEVGALCWSNELVVHVIELKTNGPAGCLEALPDVFHADIHRINGILSRYGARLMPTGMHPWMDPFTQTKLWPYEYNEIYETYNSIFDCRGHGWSNLQSTHINLPFYDDEEFARLHTAVRLVLPLLPALAASTPVMDARLNSSLDGRLETYCANQRRIPSIAGSIIPEWVSDKREYEHRILQPMYRDVAPYDPKGIIQHEWLNSRGAIARFERSTIEIRLLDIQECPRADLAIAFLITQVLKALVTEQLAAYAVQRSFEVKPLAGLLRGTIAQAENARVDDQGYREVLGYPAGGPCSAGELLYHLAEMFVPQESCWSRPLTHILTQGSLARRIVRKINNDLRPEHLREVYGELCTCLARGELFSA